jgi:hypothetical protein
MALTGSAIKTADNIIELNLVIMPPRKIITFNSWTFNNL